MTTEYICRKVNELTSTYDTRDPYELAGKLDITVLYEPMGDELNSCKGFYLYQSRRNIVVVNSDLIPETQKIILAHEMGHAVLHREEAKISAFNDFSMYDSVSKFEYDANMFAAELLLEDGEVLQILNRDDFFFNTAKILNVPPELLDFKFRILKKKGYFINSPIQSQSDFLKYVN